MEDERAIWSIHVFVNYDRLRIDEALATWKSHNSKNKDEEKTFVALGGLFWLQKKL